MSKAQTFDTSDMRLDVDAAKQAFEQIRRAVLEAASGVNAMHNGFPYPGAEHTANPPIIKAPHLAPAFVTLRDRKIESILSQLFDAVIDTADRKPSGYERCLRRWVAWQQLEQLPEWLELCWQLEDWEVWTEPPKCAHPDEFMTPDGRLT